jgi:hypothetical protein
MVEVLEQALDFVAKAVERLPSGQCRRRCR